MDVIVQSEDDLALLEVVAVQFATRSQTFWLLRAVRSFSLFLAASMVTPYTSRDVLAAPVDDFESTAALACGHNFSVPVAQFNLLDKPADRIKFVGDCRRPQAAVFRVATRDVFEAI